VPFVDSFFLLIYTFKFHFCYRIFRSWCNRSGKLLASRCRLLNERTGTLPK